ncbi:lipopolysaccharide biosynthesis protein [Salmonella enterica subsp. enterica]|uniref:Lipopolysaccharide biosynthesis protein n=1 Tax=Salmonella enterica I TaxID=59201 RepID=A0A447U0G7_SALET|nr:lipopolysaccharide biosynthesis protein [Salmonella enterica subsp. enterica]
MTANNLREQISQLVAQYANEALSPKPFVCRYKRCASFREG